LGDPRFTQALIDAVKRGVHVSIMIDQKSNVLASLNRGTCDQILRATGAPSNLDIFLNPNTLHSKLMVIDREIVALGSANFTQISHGVYEEVDCFCRDIALAQQTEALFAEHARGCVKAGKRLRYNRLSWRIEGAIVAYQARKVRRTQQPETRDLRATVTPELATDGKSVGLSLQQG